MFSIEEARAGHALVEQDVRRAEAACAAATGRRERKQAQAALDDARFKLSISTRALEDHARRTGQDVYAAPAPPPAVPAPRPGPGPGPGEPRFADRMLLSDALQTLRTFGERRRMQGDDFLESRYVAGAFFYATGDAHAGIRVWGDEDEWMISVYAAARVNMRANLELYQYVSRWRTTSGIGAPYVVQDGLDAAVMCERSYQSSQLASDVTAWRLISSTIDLVAEAAHSIARQLAHSDDGVPFTARGDVGLTLLMGWWEIHDERITRALQS